MSSDLIIETLRKGVYAALFCVGTIFVAACATSAPPTAVPPAVSLQPNSVQSNSVVATATGAATKSSAASVTVTAQPSATNVPLAAIVNKKTPITMAQLDAETNRQLDARRTLGEALPADMNAFRDSILDSLIQQALIEQAAAIQGLTVTDAEVDAEINKYIQQAGSRDNWLAQVAADHMTEAEYRIGLHSALLTLKMRDFVTASVGSTAEQVHARHILVADQATALQVLQQLQSGTAFEALAAKYSLDTTTKQSGGDLGWFTRGQLLQKSVEDAAFSLPPNQYSQPVKSDLGYHIIQVLEKSPNRPIDPATRARLQEQTFETWLDSLVKAANIVKYPKT